MTNQSSQTYMTTQLNTTFLWTTFGIQMKKEKEKGRPQV
jgi:hypothetical protein